MEHASIGPDSQESTSVTDSGGFVESANRDSSRKTPSLEGEHDGKDDNVGSWLEGNARGQDETFEKQWRKAESPPSEKSYQRVEEEDDGELHADDGAQNDQGESDEDADTDETPEHENHHEEADKDTEEDDEGDEHDVEEAGQDKEEDQSEEGDESQIANHVEGVDQQDAGTEEESNEGNNRLPQLDRPANNQPSSQAHLPSLPLVPPLKVKLDIPPLPLTRLTPPDLSAKKFGTAQNQAHVDAMWTSLHNAAYYLQSFQDDRDECAARGEKAKARLSRALREIGMLRRKLEDAEDNHSREISRVETALGQLMGEREQFKSELAKTRTLLAEAEDNKTNDLNHHRMERDWLIRRQEVTEQAKIEAAVAKAKQDSFKLSAEIAELVKSCEEVKKDAESRLTEGYKRYQFWQKLGEEAVLSQRHFELYLDVCTCEADRVNDKFQEEIARRNLPGVRIKKRKVLPQPWWTRDDIWEVEPLKGEAKKRMCQDQRR